MHALCVTIMTAITLDRQVCWTVLNTWQQQWLAARQDSCLCAAHGDFSCTQLFDVPPCDCTAALTTYLPEMRNKTGVNLLSSKDDSGSVSTQVSNLHTLELSKV